MLPDGTMNARVRQTSKKAHGGDGPPVTQEKASGTNQTPCITGSNLTPIGTRAKASVGESLSVDRTTMTLEDAQREFAKLHSIIAELKLRVETLERGVKAPVMETLAQRLAKRSREEAKTRTDRKTEIIVAPDPAEEEIKRRRGVDTLQAVRKEVGEAVAHARRLPNGNTVLQLAPGKEDALLSKDDWMLVTFGKKAKVVKGGYMVLIKGMTQREMEGATDELLKREFGAMQTTRKIGPQGYGTILCRIPNAEVARKMTTEGAKIGHQIFKCEPFLNRNHTRQCFNCFGWGHIGKACRNSPRCHQCGLARHDGGCTRMRCVNCTGNHPATDRSLCPTARQVAQEAASAYSNRPRQFVASKGKEPEANAGTTDNNINNNTDNIKNNTNNKNNNTTSNNTNTNTNNSKNNNTDINTKNGKAKTARLNAEPGEVAADSDNESYDTAEEDDDVDTEMTDIPAEKKGHVMETRRRLLARKGTSVAPTTSPVASGAVTKNKAVAKIANATDSKTKRLADTSRTLC